MDLTGQKFGRLTVIERCDGEGSGCWWKCACDCGNTKIQKTSRLRSGGAKSCGCARADSIRIASQAAWKVTTKWTGPHKTRLKVLFGNMRKRCYDPKNKRFPDWGGRGITICEEWMSNRSSFFTWASENGYKPGLSIDRINNNGNYEPANCRFVSMEEQNSNTRKNVFLTHDGITLTVSQWARKIGVRPKALQHRIGRGWSISRIFSQPFRRSKNVHA